MGGTTADQVSTSRLRRGRALVVVLIVVDLLISIVLVYGFDTFNASAFLFLLYLLYILYQGADWAAALVGAGSVLFGGLGLVSSGILAAEGIVGGSLSPEGWVAILLALWGLACAGILFFSPSVRTFLEQQKAGQAPLLRKRAWLVIPIVVVAGAADVLLSTSGPSPVGLPPGWGPTLLKLLVAGLPILVVWLLSRARQPDGKPHFDAQQIFPLPLALGLCSVAALVVGGWGAYRYYVAMPGLLRGTWHSVAVPRGTGFGDVSAAAEDSQGRMWFATDNGVSVLDPAGQWATYRAADGLAADMALDVAADGRGRVWVATGAGLSRFDGSRWQTFALAGADKRENWVWRLALDAQDQAWFLSGAGLSVIRADDTRTQVGLPPGVNDDLGALTVDAAGRVWVLTMWGDDTIAEYDPGQQRWTRVERVGDHVAYSSEGRLPGFFGIAADREPGHLWIASSTIVELNGDEWRAYQPGFRPAAVLVDAEGYRWFSSLFDGLLLLSPDGQKWWHYADNERGKGIGILGADRQITQDALGRYWFTGMEGVVEFVPAGR